MRYLNHEKIKGDRSLRLCERCKLMKAKELGKYMPLADGLHQKWFCLQCWDRRNHR